MLRQVWWIALLLGCRNVPALIDASAGSGGGDDDGGLDGGSSPPPDASTPGLSDDGDALMRRSCVESFGDAITPALAYGRLDGYLVAIVQPGSSSRPCHADLTHLHLQILMLGKTYDVAVNIGGTDVHSKAFDHAPFSTWAEGWHTGSDVYVEYTGLGLHSATMPAVIPAADLAAAITADLASTNRISIYATSYSSEDGAHLVHRNGGGADGLIVTKPLSGTAHMRAFSFDTQVF